MMLDQMNVAISSDPLFDTAWTILEAANDLGDRATVEVCRRVIDASFAAHLQRGPTSTSFSISLGDTDRPKVTRGRFF
jgi:hypothetical protein